MNKESVNNVEKKLKKHWRSDFASDYYTENMNAVIEWKQEAIDKIISLLDSWGYETVRFVHGNFKYDIPYGQCVSVVLNHVGTPKLFEVKLLERRLPVSLDIADEIRSQIQVAVQHAEKLNQVIKELQWERA